MAELISYRTVKVHSRSIFYRSRAEGCAGLFCCFSGDIFGQSPLAVEIVPNKS